MPMHDQENVIVENAIVVWDAITMPEVPDHGGPAKYKIKVIIPAGSPDADLVNQIASNCLMNSKWKGQMPQGGVWPITPVAPGEYGDMFPGGHVINPSSKHMPDVYNDAGQKMDPMQYNGLLYQGQSVDVIVNAWDFDNRAKGVSSGLQGLRINLSRNAPRQQITQGGGTGFNVAGVFGGGGQAPAQQGAPQG